MATTYDRQITDEVFNTIVRENGVRGLPALSDVIDFVAQTSAATATGTRRVAVPSTATSTGTVGDWAADATYLYVCHATNTWKRVAIATW